MLIEQLDVHVEQTISQIFGFHDLNKLLLEKVQSCKYYKSDIIEEAITSLCNCCYMEQGQEKVKEQIDLYMDKIDEMYINTMHDLFKDCNQLFDDFASLDYVYSDDNDLLKRIKIKRESEDEFKTIIDKTFQTLYYDMGNILTEIECTSQQHHLSDRTPGTSITRRTDFTRESGVNQEELNRLRLQTAAEQRQIIGLQEQLSAAQRQFEDVERQMNEAQTRFNAEQTQKNDALAQLAAAQIQKQQAQQQLHESQQQLAAERQDALARLADSQQQLDELQTRLTSEQTQKQECLQNVRNLEQQSDTEISTGFRGQTAKQREKNRDVQSQELFETDGRRK
jgi:hypothetical protein